MHYYKVCLIGKRAPHFTYSSSEKIELHTLVAVEIRGRRCDACVISEVCKPDFETSHIKSVTPFCFSQFQIETAHFIKSYYSCTLGESLSLFLPFEDREVKPSKYMEFKTQITLSSSQSAAMKELKTYPSALLFAPTGSGKTEVYMKLFEEAVKAGRSCIFLMPEISLTPQMEKRLKAHFGESVAIWHSKLTKRRREETIAKIRSGEVRIVAGPRSALFLPLHDIGLIVVDEEHDDSYKAHNRPRYHARDLALFMGRKLGAKVVLGSATPSASTFARQPVVRIKDPFVRTKKRFIFEKGGYALTPTMLSAIESHKKAGGQMIVFLPTRANFKYLYCESCGYTLECPFCSVGMSLHRHRKQVQCHYCGYAERIPQKCPKCGSVIRADRIGTAEVVEELGERFPDLKIQQFDKDTISTANKLHKALERFSRKETDILVGTQMLAKGHDYADITLAIVLGLDYILALPDYRARERAQALFVQIAGRAGRAREAEVIVQTNQPEFFTEYLGHYEKFLKEELKMREGLYPPTMHLCRLLFSSKEEAKGAAALERVKKRIDSFGKVEIVGAGKAPIERIAGKFRFNILLRSSSRSDLLKVLKAVDDGSFEVDMDPVDFA